MCAWLCSHEQGVCFLLNKHLLVNKGVGFQVKVGLRGAVCPPFSVENDSLEKERAAGKEREEQSLITLFCSLFSVPNKKHSTPDKSSKLLKSVQNQNSFPSVFVLE